jgi:hypothetical protein
MTEEHNIMNNKNIIHILILALALFAPQAYAEPPTKYRVSVGTMVFSDFSSQSEADYLGASFSMPVSFSIKKSDYRLSLTSAYLSQIQDDDTLSSGLGDTSLSIYYNINDWLSIKAKHKFATGNQGLGFSTGEDDNALSLDYFYFQSYSTSFFATTGYKWVGKGDRTDRQNALNGSLGMSYSFSNTFTLANSLDYNQSSYTNGSDVYAATLFGSHKLNKASYVGWFVGIDDTNTYSSGVNYGYSF